VSTKVRYASAFAVAVTLITTLFSAEGSGAIAQSYQPAVMQHPTEFTAQPVVQQLPAKPAVTTSANDVAPEATATAADTSDDQASTAQQPLSREMNCLAGAIYFESKGEPLDGQLAVGRVIVERSHSGRFPDSYCGVVFQPSQFSFVRGHAMPHIDKSSQNWANAVAMAKLADSGARKSRADGALFFHAARVSPNWRLTRVASIGNHIFYR
jgi:N-acetylmuramoyl-L-alanine amidase